ncbi:MAG: hypothetical protein NT124_02710 [Candidatus Dependentiae bacterium]|nr:hypothetical protein [Candidatus Dependentiae bacterium]
MKKVIVMVVACVGMVGLSLNAAPREKYEQDVSLNARRAVGCGVGIRVCRSGGAQLGDPEFPVVSPCAQGGAYVNERLCSMQEEIEKLQAQVSLLAKALMYLENNEIYGELDCNSELGDDCDFDCCYGVSGCSGNDSDLEESGSHRVSDTLALRVKSEDDDLEPDDFCLPPDID